MLNPSTADAEIDDPTIRRCIGFSSAFGYGGIVVGNLFAWRATEPSALKEVADPIGPSNDSHLAKIISDAPLVICAWGTAGNLYGRDREVLRMIRDAGKVPHCLRVTKGGHPSHPLYLSATLKPVPLA